MGRSLTIVVLVALFMASGVAAASDTADIRLPVSARGEPEGPATVVVEKGDHLWKISARHLQQEEKADQPVAPYWREVVDVNTPALRSGDPDLIYPGEMIELPEISEQP